MPDAPRWTTPVHVIWDLDGTLLDTYPAIDGALVAALAEQGVRLEVGEVAPLTRVTLDHAVRTLCARWGLDEGKLYAAYEVHHARLAPELTRALPGALAALTAVWAGGGLNLLATHRARASSLALLGGLGLLPLLDDVLSVRDPDPATGRPFPRKPDPALFLHLLRRHGLSPAGVLAVGDRALDVEAAHAAGLRAALLLTPGVRLDTPADHLLTSLEDLGPLLGRLTHAGR